MHTLRRQRGEFAEELLSCVGAIFGFACGFLQDLLAEAEKGTCDGVGSGSSCLSFISWRRMSDVLAGTPAG